MTLLLYFALGGALFLLPFELIRVEGYSATAAGAALAAVRDRDGRVLVGRGPARRAHRRCACSCARSGGRGARDRRGSALRTGVRLLVPRAFPALLRARRSA